MMAKKYFFTMILIIIFVGNLYPQNYKSSFIVEGALLSTESYNIELQMGIVTREYYSKEFLKGLSMAYSGKIHLGSDYFLEFRPGLLISQKAYDGLQLGLNLKKEFNIFSGFLGLNSNYNFNPSHGIVNNENPVEMTYMYVVGFGVKINKTFGLLLSYNKLFDDYFGSGQTTDSISRTNGYKKYLHYFIKLGLELNL